MPVPGMFSQTVRLVVVVVVVVCLLFMMMMMMCSVVAVSGCSLCDRQGTC